MGTFQITITAMGGHGCQRDLGADAIVDDCGVAACLDCQARRFVDALEASGALISAATLTHWPGTDYSVVDDLQTHVRSGSFPA